jgi:hypothetical protein
VDRRFLYNTLKEFGIPNKLVSLIKITLENSKSKVKIQGQMSEVFQVKRGLKQGDALSTVLFNVVLEKIIINMEINPKGTIFNRTRQYLAYADDVVILGRSVTAIEEVVTQLQEATQTAGLIINQEKTKYMEITRKTDIEQALVINDMLFEEVNCFKYLGSMITSKNEIKEEIKARITAVNSCYYALKHIFKSRAVSKAVKTKIYKTLVKPIVMYGSEAWPLTEADMIRLNTWERKILRCIHGPVVENEYWRIGTNHELQILYKDTDIVADIRRRSLQWLGHMIRMDDSRLRKRELDGKPGGRRTIGSPRLRWLEDVEKVLKQLKVRGW